MGEPQDVKKIMSIVISAGSKETAIQNHLGWARPSCASLDTPVARVAALDLAAFSKQASVGSSREKRE